MTQNKIVQALISFGNSCFFRVRYALILQQGPFNSMFKPCFSVRTWREEK